jgi:hypothetical protein
VGAKRGGREDSPLAGLLRRSPRQGEVPERQVPERDQGDEWPAPRDTGVGDGRRVTGPADLRGEARHGTAGVGRPTQKRRGRPRGGRRSNPDYVQISARIHKEVRFSLERVLAERSELEGRYVEMAEVIENLMRFYVENGDPYEMLER